MLGQGRRSVGEGRAFERRRRRCLRLEGGVASEGARAHNDVGLRATTAAAAEQMADALASFHRSQPAFTTKSPLAGLCSPSAPFRGPRSFPGRNAAAASTADAQKLDAVRQHRPILLAKSNGSARERQRKLQARKRTRAENGKRNGPRRENADPTETDECNRAWLRSLPVALGI